jgi:hypothetical protein
MIFDCFDAEDGEKQKEIRLEHVAQKCERFCENNMRQNKELEHVFDSIKNKRALAERRSIMMVAPQNDG